MIKDYVNHTIQNGDEKTQNPNELPEILCITTYPPRECGIATYSSDLVKALEDKFDKAFKMTVCPLISSSGQGWESNDIYPIIDQRDPLTFLRLADYISQQPAIKMVLIQHEFGLYKERESSFMSFLAQLQLPIIISFHTVLPNPDKLLRKQVKKMSVLVKYISVMTRKSAEILERDYDIKNNKIQIIPHGTHLVLHKDKQLLKEHYGVTGREVLSTFGLLGPGKSIETTLQALPAIISERPNVLFLIIGKTHPSLLKEQGEHYRDMLKNKIAALGLEDHVQFLDRFLDLPVLLDYLQLTDIYLFTSKDRNQAVSGTFSYAVSCGCPIISTPIPHAKEVLKENMGVIVDFEDPGQLSKAVIKLLKDVPFRKEISKNEILATAPTSWENVAISHAILFKKLAKGSIKLRYSLPPINLKHLKKLTTSVGMVQFCEINTPDLNSGYTLDDNARALVAVGEHYRLTQKHEDLKYLNTYFDFIAYCFQPNGHFLNYVNANREFTSQNDEVNLEDANGRAIWALGYLISLREILPESCTKMLQHAENILENSKNKLRKIHSTRAMAFIIKGLYYHHLETGSACDCTLASELADRLVHMYQHEGKGKWKWFESYMTYGNSILPEALLCAWEMTGTPIYKTIANESFDFLLSKIVIENSIRVISNRGWLHKEKAQEKVIPGGEQPIDVAYTIMALSRFHKVFPEAGYLDQLKDAFNWFLGDNHLNQIIYNPRTGGCYDGLEEHNVNLNQGAESTLSYLLSRLVLEENVPKNSNETLETISDQILVNKLQD
ncbi:MAG TPA: glycosyltransferase [Leeuwenhoekiella sp.]|nr:glycosyltransferase [Leeuwenhoekiella sp.]